MNGKLVSQNPRFLLKNNYSSELIIQSLHASDQGLYECRTDQIINSIIHLNIVHRKCHDDCLIFLKILSFILVSTIHLTVPENSNVTLQCMDNGMWIIEESHRGGPIRKSALVLNRN